MNAQAIVAALFNAGWQGGVLSLGALLAFRRFRAASATTMFYLWVALLAICLALPFIDLAMAQSSNAPALPIANGATLPNAIPALNGPAENHRPVPAPAVPIPTRRASQHEAVLPGALTWAWMAMLRHGALIVLLLAAVAAVRLGCVVRDIAWLRAARRRVEPIDPPIAMTYGRRAVFAASDTFASACVLGFATPMVVLPSSLLEGSPARLRAVVLHELAHVRRYDDVQQLIARVVLAIAYCLPGVLLALRQIALFRECICDDIALRETGDPLRYASDLAHLLARGATVRSAVPGLIFERKHALRRIHALADARVSHAVRVTGGPLFVVALACALSGALLVSQFRLPALAQPAAKAVAEFVNRGDDVHVHVHLRGADAVSDAIRSPFTGTWKIDSCGDAPPTSVNLSLAWRYRDAHHDDSWSEGICIPLSALPRLTLARLRGPATPQTFVLQRDAGSFDMTGTLGSIRGTGSWTFVPDAAFVAALARRNVGAPDALEQFQLATGDFHLATLDMLLQHGFAAPRVGDLVKLVEIGPPDALVRAVAGLPGQPRTLATVQLLAEVGVRPSFVTGLLQRGYRPTLRDVARLGEVGATLPWIDRLRANGDRDLSISHLILLREAGG